MLSREPRRHRRAAAAAHRRRQAARCRARDPRGLGCAGVDDPREQDVPDPQPDAGRTGAGHADDGHGPRALRARRHGVRSRARSRRPSTRRASPERSRRTRWLLCDRDALWPLHIMNRAGVIIVAVACLVVACSTSASSSGGAGRGLLRGERVRRADGRQLPQGNVHGAGHQRACCGSVCPSCEAKGLVPYDEPASAPRAYVPRPTYGDARSAATRAGPSAPSRCPKPDRTRPTRNPTVTDGPAHQSETARPCHVT